MELSNPGFDLALNAVQAGQADAVLAGMSITDARKEIFDFSDSYYTSNILLAVKGSSVTNYSDLKGATVGAKNGTASYTFLEKNADKYGYTLKAFDEASSMYDNLNSGSIDALMDDEAVLRYAITKVVILKYLLMVNLLVNMDLLLKKEQTLNSSKCSIMVLRPLKNLENTIKSSLNTSVQKKKKTSTKTVDETTIFGLISNNYKQLLSGLGTTLSLTLISFAIATIIGIIFGMMAVSPNNVLRTIAAIFVDVVRGIPLMIVSLPSFSGESQTLLNPSQVIKVQSMILWVATIALSLNGGAYIAEIVRGGIEAVPSGQMEASRSLGISYNTTMRKVILPQAVKLMLPSFINQFVISLKDTTIVSAIGLVELFQTGKIIIARNYQSFRMYAILAIIYLVMITILTRLAKRLEKRLK